MKFKVHSKEIELRYTTRMFMIYENITGKSIDFKSMTGYTTVVNLLYSAILGTLQKNRMELDYSYDDFLDDIDEVDIAEVMKEFSEWLTENIMIQAKLSPKVKEQVKKEAKQSKSKN